MKPGALAGYVLGGLALLILDAITLLLVFSIWALVNLPVFPWALTHILFVLALLHLVFLLSPQITRRFGTPVLAIGAAATLANYLFVMAFTGLTYPVISVRLYILGSLISLLFYVLICFGLLYAGLAHGRQLERQKAEQAAVLEHQLPLLAIGQSIGKLNGRLTESDYQALNQAYQRMLERFRASTPAGRISRPEINSLEQLIHARIDHLNNAVAALNSQADPAVGVAALVADLDELRGIIAGKEKLIVH